MQTVTAKEAKYGFGRLIDLARAEPVAVTKHGRPVVVVLSCEIFERLAEAAAMHEARGAVAANGLGAVVKP